MYRLLALFSLLFPDVFHVFSAEVASTSIRVLTYTTPSCILLAGLPFSGPPIAIAKEEVEKEYGLNITNVIIAKNGLVTCDDAIANTYLVPEYVFTKWNDDEPFFLLNPGCYDEIILGYYGREWNVPIMTSGTTYPLFYDNEAFPTMVSFAALDFNQLIQGLFDIFDHFSWTSVAVIHDSSKLNTLYSGIFDLLMASTARTIRFLSIPIDTSSNDTIPYRSILDQIMPVSRVVLLLMMARPARDFLIAAQKAGRTNGEYVYLMAEPFEGIRRFGNLTWQMGDAHDEIAREAFRSLLQLTASCFSAGQHPQQVVMDRIKAAGITQYNTPYMPHEETSAATMGQYYSMKALGEVLSEAVQENADLRDGRAFAERFHNRTFKFHGGKLVIGPNGVRIQDYCIRDLDTRTGLLQAKLSYDALTRKFQNIDHRIIDWASPKNIPPANEPHCGFTGDKYVCRDGWSMRDSAYVAVPLVVLLIVCFVTVSWYLTKTLRIGEWWRLDPSEHVYTRTTISAYVQSVRPPVVLH